MNPVYLQESLANIRAELEVQQGIEPAVLEQVRRLDIQMHQMIESNELMAEEKLSEELIALEAQFASNHPNLEKMIRNLVDALAQMGI